MEPTVRTRIGTVESSRTEKRLAVAMAGLGKLVVTDPEKIEQMERERRRQRLDGICAGAGFPKSLRAHTFERATFPEDADSTAAIYDRLKDWTPRTGGSGLLLMGRFGRGKSYLMHALINRLLEQGMSYFRYFPFGKMIRNLWSYSSSYERETYWTTLCNAGHVFIDDLGRAPKNAKGGSVTWWVDLIFEFVDTHEVLQLPVVYTTNLDKKQLRQLT